MKSEKKVPGARASARETHIDKKVRTDLPSGKGGTTGGIHVEAVTRGRVADSERCSGKLA